MSHVLESINGFVWGYPALILILCTGLWLSIRSCFSQIRFLGVAFRNIYNKLRPPDSNNRNMTPFQTLCTALAATVGTGNIAGVAGAIAIGGPGAVFWMWICGLLGMVIKFSEATLAVHFQQVGSDGKFYGGPMHMIERGLGKRWHWLAYVYCFLGVVAAFGVGNATQINAVVDSFHATVISFGGNPSFSSDLLLGIFLSIIVGYVLLGGSSRIGSVAEMLVPFTACTYILFGLGVIIFNADMIPAAFRSIILGAFSPRAVTGGAIGSFFLTLKTGVSRGVFTNEAGMGTASIAYASSHGIHPVEQGLLGIVEVFLDTIVICTITALAILCSGISIPFGNDQGATLTVGAFVSAYGSWVTLPLTFFLCSFALATILGWGFYGMQCAQYLFRQNVWKQFAVLQIIFITVSAVLKTETVWLIAEIMNGLMTIPNLIAVTYLSPLFIKLLSEYKSITSRISASGGTYESFNQRKSLRALSNEKVPSSCHSSRKKGQTNLPSKHRTARSGNTESFF